MMGKKVVIALGGNAILQPKQTPTFENQYHNIENATRHMVEIKEAGHQIIVTHGNGPQVGNIIAQNEAAKETIPPSPIDACNAQSQGLIGYMMEQCLKNHLQKRHMTDNVVSLLTMVEVDPKDPAFELPTKPIGVFFNEAEAKKMEAQGFPMVEDAGRGYRRVVPSPEPMRIHGVDEIKQILDHTIVISSGGGGIPVYKDEEQQLHGLEAVIDKDRSGLKLAEQVEADVFMMLTDVPNVYINYGQPNQATLNEVSVQEIEQYIQENQFPKGSMLPKIEAALQFAKSGKEAIICALDEAVDALAGKAGTRIVLK